MSETAVVKFEPGAPLGNERMLATLLASNAPKVDQVLASLDQAWPGDGDPQRRRLRSEQLIRQTILALGGSEARDTLVRCCTVSVLDSMIAAAALDLSVQKAMAEAYFVPFKGVCTLMVGYRGFIKLIVNTGAVSHLESVLVYDGDEFKLWRDENGPHVHHVPNLIVQGQGDKVTGCYAIAYRPGQPSLIEYMNREQLEQVRNASPAFRNKKGPYMYWLTEMWRKAPIRRLEKYIPKTASPAAELLGKALEHDSRMYELENYQQARQAFAAERGAAKKEAWDAAAAAPAGRLEPACEPPGATIAAETAPDPAEESTWPTDPETGDRIPPQFWGKE